MTDQQPTPPGLQATSEGLNELHRRLGAEIHTGIEKDVRNAQMALRLQEAMRLVAVAHPGATPPQDVGG